MSDVHKCGHRQKSRWVLQGTATLACVLLLPHSAHAGNVVTRWAEHAMQVVRAANVGTPNAGRLYAMVTVAMYDAVNGINTAQRHGREHALVPGTAAPQQGSRNAAAAAAAHAVLVGLVPAQMPDLDAALAEDLTAALDGDAAAGQQWGQYVGEQVVALRSNDGTQTAEIISGGSGIGVHRADFDARFRNMTPFAIRSAARYVSGPPPANMSAEYARAFQDVKRLGQQDGDPERDEIAVFWLAEGGTVRETGAWIQAAVAIVEQQGTDRSLSDTARLFARIGMAIADAVTVVWETKAAFFTWRPFYAIREAESDGNPNTSPDPLWTPRNTSIGASPEYNSGTSAFAGAASVVIQAFYFPRVVSFCFATDLAASGARCFNSPRAAAVEAGRSRIYQGIHFQFSNEDGRRAGRRIGLEVALTTLRRCFAHSEICVP
jgi:PAP2 superfamily